MSSKDGQDEVQLALIQELRALKAEVSALREHLGHVGYLVQVIETRGRRKPFLTAQARATLKAQLLHRSWPIRRVLGFLAHPGRAAGHIAAIYRDAKPTSSRARWIEGKWRTSSDFGSLLRTMSQRISARLSNARPAIYTIKQLHPKSEGLRPRVLHAIPNVFVGGSTQLIVDLHDHLGHKYDMHVMTSAVPAGVSHVGMVVHDFHEPTSVAAMLDLMRKFEPNVIHVHYWGEVDKIWYKKVFDAAARADIPIILNINTPVEPYDDPGVVECVYVSDYVRQEFGGVFDHEVVIHPGIDLQRFHPATLKDPHANDSIGMVYRLEPDKLDMNSIAVLIEVVKRRPQTRAVVVGGGSLFEPFLDQTVKEGVRSNFDFAGYVPYETLQDYYRMFSVFVAPVWKESFGQVTPFAMAMGLAVAGNRVGALPEILESDETLGSSIGETADKIIALLDDPQRAKILGEQNRLICLSKYAVTVMCSRYDEVYRRALGDTWVDPMVGFPAAEIFHPV